MTRRALELSRLPIFATMALALALVTIPGRGELLVHIYLLFLASVALSALVGHVRRANPVAARSPFDVALRGRPLRPERLADLERIEREFTLAGHTAADFHFRFRPRLRRIAAQLLASRRGVDLDGNPDAARRALGEELWQLVRADREAPRRRDAPGLSLPEAERIVTALEGL
jgi:hypothetical protein